MAKHLATMQGALKDLPVYRNATAVLLNEDAEWRLACAGAQKMARQETARTPQAASFEQILKVLRKTTSLPMRALIMTAWATAGRVGDCTKLKKSDIVVTPKVLQVTWRRGKTVGSRGPYTVSVAPPAEWLTTISKWCETRHDWVFPRECTTAAVLVALRTTEPELECRSIRRGALQALAAAGVDDATMMLISGHTVKATLLRYLEWGKGGLLRNESMSKASKAIFATVKATE